MSQLQNIALNTEQQFTNKHNINNHTNQSQDIRIMPKMYGLSNPSTSILSDEETIIESDEEPTILNNSLIEHKPIPKILPDDTTKYSESSTEDLFNQQFQALSKIRAKLPKLNLRLVRQPRYQYYRPKLYYNIWDQYIEHHEDYYDEELGCIVFVIPDRIFESGFGRISYINLADD
ncbi:hypothetical protein BN7_5133 [Wickerhamomyces ciferrii]|uniref:Uncharacterized protein n=1 Tax=Wickerhamomyces ciferrii (strain ATCC 14091 / BCRC 22168 / CBS 111 / JCM 3599 / NBRC 0793 / NRRL Y-1031 F-60-10) TaxID=1206466 RepID=K0KR03_WICCF|nr:uncharacterized protein BN7_5133 [Wickerhamomyces ciferrii]CCH45551.1 hypothetical protein BN7_5133 [Wickerhamomyces ciferrii]